MAITRRTRSAVPLALAALLLTGCADDGGDTATPPPPPSATAASASPTSSPDTREWATCISTRADLRVSYPADWTAREHSSGGCAYFDPQPFEVERATEAPAVAVRLDVEAVSYDRVKAAYLDGEVLAQQDAEIAGADAMRIEDRATEGPLAPKGHRVTYLADLGEDATLVLTTNETDARDFAQAQQVLDEMAQRLTGA